MSQHTRHAALGHARVPSPSYTRGRRVQCGQKATSIDVDAEARAVAHMLTKKKRLSEQWRRSYIDSTAWGVLLARKLWKGGCNKLATHGRL